MNHPSLRPSLGVQDVRAIEAALMIADVELTDATHVKHPDAVSCISADYADAFASGYHAAIDRAVEEINHRWKIARERTVDDTARIATIIAAKGQADD